MNNISEINNPRAVEDLVCSRLRTAPTLELDLEEFELLTILLELRKETTLVYSEPRDFESHKVTFSSVIEAKLFSEHLLSRGGRVKGNPIDTDLKENLMMSFNKGDQMTFLIEAARGRASILNLDIDLLSLIFLASICKNIGNLVIYLTYAKYMVNRLTLGKVDIQTLGRYIIPNGKFTEKEIKIAWENQKVDTSGSNYRVDNLIDYQSALQSIINKQP